MRKNFADVLKEAHIDIKEEYQKLYDMLFIRSIVTQGQTRISMHDELGDCFHNFYFRGTCLSIDEFDRKYDFKFAREPEDFSIDSLILICEYICNMLNAYQSCIFSGQALHSINVQFFFSQIYAVIEAVGYMPSTKDGFIIFVEKSPAAIAVAEIMPRELSYKVISYNHYSMKGNLELKKNTLLLFADILEPKRSEIQRIDSEFTSDLFYAFNNFNIRHNNADPKGNKYKQTIADMSNEELEHWYDETYQMCLLAFLRLEQAERKVAFDEIKSRIQSRQ